MQRGSLKGAEDSMLKIEKDSVPDFWSKVIKRTKNYDGLDSSDEGRIARQKLRNHLIEVQKGICAYCCKSIDSDSSLTEHIKPRDGFPNNTLDYDNMIASCREYDTCSSSKGNEYSSLFVSPLEDDVESHFAFAPDGTLICLSERAEFTCKLLNLNSYRLKKARAATLQFCKSYGDDTDLINEYYLCREDGNYEAFADIIKYYCEHEEIR